MSVVPQTKVRDWAHPDWDWRYVNWKIEQIEGLLTAIGYHAYKTGCEYGGHHLSVVGGVSDLHVCQRDVDLTLILCQKMIGEGTAFGGTFAVYADTPAFAEQVLSEIGVCLYHYQRLSRWGQVGAGAELEGISVISLELEASGGYRGDAVISFRFAGRQSTAASANFLNFRVKNQQRGGFHLDRSSKAQLWGLGAAFRQVQNQDDEAFNKLLVKVEGEISRAIHHLDKPKKEAV